MKFWSLQLTAVLAVMGSLPLLCFSTPLNMVRRFKKKSNDEQTQTYWKKIAQDELDVAIRLTNNNKVAKNVILFLGDGMSIPTITAGRIYKGQLSSRSGEEGRLFFETFPHVGLSKTYNVDKQVADSASTATAYLTGVKTNYKTLGVDGSAIYKDCFSITEENKVYSIVKWAQDAGKRTGVVTSTRVTHATPGATYAHVTDRDWECDGDVPDECKNASVVKDIGRQLIEDEPGASINVVMGGGYQELVADPDKTNVSFSDPIDWSGCLRQDKRNLINQWKEDKDKKGVKNAFITRKKDLNALETSDLEYLMGIFANDHLPYEYEKTEEVPTLAEMTRVAIEILQQGSDGYFLLVEGGRIDHAHHDSMAHIALDELVAFDEAISVAATLVNMQDTLIVVTADHAHTMSISGYPDRGQDIIGIAGYADDDTTYTTLMYANGPGYNGTRYNITTEEAMEWEYTQMATVPKDSETHGGDDVAIYAWGPMAHLFHGLHEQNFIAHVMAYSACIGEYDKDCRGAGEKAKPIFLLIIISISTWILS